MPRPIKCRKVRFIPDNKEFSPVNQENSDKIILKIEELESIRLKDLVGLNQEECAKMMQISRQTFQNIIDSAHKKVANALINGYSIKIGGGNYVKGNCVFNCLDCNKKFEQQRNTDMECPHCGSNNIICSKKRKHCTKL